MHLQGYLLPAERLLALTLVLARLSGFFASAPFFSSRSVLLPIRAGLALAVAFLILPTLPEGVPPPGGTLGTAVLVAKETAIGLLFGGAVQVFFAALQLAGQLAGTQLGLSITAVVDPTTQVRNNLGPALYQFYGMVLFLVAGGHRQVLAAVVESYRLLPVGAGSLTPGLLAAGVGLSRGMFEVGVRLAAPVAATLFVVDLTLALASRVAPSIPILMIGLPAKSWLGLALLAWAFAYYPGPCLAWLGRADGELIGLARHLATGGVAR